MENSKMTTEEVIRFLDVLETENEDALTKIIEDIQEVEQKLREVDYSLSELDKKQDSNMNFFSPVGVYEEGEEKRELLQAAEDLKEMLPKLNSKLEQYKYRKEQLQVLRMTFLTVKEESAGKEEGKAMPVEKQQGLHILESHECERNRIAMDLHDSSVQILTSLVHKTELCMRLMDIDTIRVKLELQTMIETIKSVISGMREIIYNLRPMSLDNLGLGVTIESYCHQLKKNHDMEAVFHNMAGEPELPSIYKVTLYRILQETCQNILKHARATKTDVSLSYENQNIKLVIRDNGIGFDTQKVTVPTNGNYGFGLSMIKERAILLGGTIQIDSVIGEGTTVSVEIPLLQEKEEMCGND